MNIECPSGRIVEIRKMKLSDEDIITDVNLARDGSNVDILLKNITGLSKEELDDMLVGDRVFILVEVRKLSKGNSFYPKITCPNCRTGIEVEVDLDALRIQKLDRTLSDENHEFELTLPSSGAKLIARLLRGKNEKEIKKIRTDHPDKIMSYLMMLRTVSVAGERVKNINWYRDLDVDDADYFNQEYEKRDCGVDTTIEGTCQKCQSKFDFELPFGAPFFLQTGRAKKNSEL